MPSFSNLFALSSLAALIVTSGVAPVTALSISPAVNVARHANIARHVKVNKGKRDNLKRCNLRARPQTESTPPPSNGDNNANSAPPPSNGNTNTPAPAPSDGNNNNNTPAPAPSDGGNTNNSQPPPTNTDNSNTGVAPANNGNGSGGNGNTKRGAAWPNGPDDLPKWPGLAWLYTWSPYVPNNCQALGIDCVPMLWGWNQLDQFKQLTSQDGYATTALGPNEPDMNNNGDLSAGIDPNSCADLWRQGMEPLKAKGYRLGAPATTSSPNGKVWMQNFLNACQGCNIDFYPLHWYDVGFDKFQAYVTDWHNTFGKNVWVTEYACQNFNGGAQCTDGEVWDFLQKSVTWMEQTPWIERYSWFGMMHDMVNVNYDNQLMGQDGGPNAKGSWYLTN